MPDPMVKPQVIIKLVQPFHKEVAPDHEDNETGKKVLIVVCNLDSVPIPETNDDGHEIEKYNRDNGVQQIPRVFLLSQDGDD